MSDKVEQWMFGPGATDTRPTAHDPADALTMPLDKLPVVIARERGWMSGFTKHENYPCYHYRGSTFADLPNWPSSWADAGPLWEEMTIAALVLLALWLIASERHLGCYGPTYRGGIGPRPA